MGACPVGCRTQRVHAKGIISTPGVAGHGNVLLGAGGPGPLQVRAKARARVRVKARVRVSVSVSVRVRLYN